MYCSRVCGSGRGLRRVSWGLVGADSDGGNAYGNVDLGSRSVDAQLFDMVAVTA